MLDKAGFSGKPPAVPPEPIEDIPEALRDTPDALPPRRRSQPLLLIGGSVGAIAIAIGSGLWFSWQAQQSPLSASPQTAQPNGTSATSPPEAAPTPDAVAGTLLGHYPYDEAPVDQLQPIVPDGRIKMRQAAAEAFLAMQAAAQADGVYLAPISGFRTLEDQQFLFFDVKAERGQVATERAEVSAPPGYSEHHTGYAVDIGDENVPATNLSPDFENTAAFKWMEANAAHFSFELSFPKNNSQGVSYEPWHWRFVGDRDSLETFYKARGEK